MKTHYNYTHFEVQITHLALQVQLTHSVFQDARCTRHRMHTLYCEVKAIIALIATLTMTGSAALDECLGVRGLGWGPALCSSGAGIVLGLGWGVLTLRLPAVDRKEDEVMTTNRISASGASILTNLTILLTRLNYIKKRGPISDSFKWLLLRQYIAHCCISFLSFWMLVQHFTHGHV